MANLPTTCGLFEIVGPYGFEMLCESMDNETLITLIQTNRTYRDLCQPILRQRILMKKIESLSSEAIDVINQDFIGKNLIDIKETIHHDGYDSYGPESNLWNLYLIEENGGNYHLYCYHWEDWFDSDPEKYTLYSQKPINREDVKQVLEDQW